MIVSDMAGRWDALGGVDSVNLAQYSDNYDKFECGTIFPYDERSK